ncbi:ATP-binding cassette domain-containing protein, partial [Angustibacter aerolatus]
RAAGPLRSALDDAPPAPRRAAPTTGPLLAADAVVVRHGDVTAVAGVDLALRDGEVTALMGRNGAGKSSLLWALQGSGRRTGGRVQVSGDDPARLGAARRRALVGLVPQQPSDLLYLDTVAAELAQADRDADRPSGTAAALLQRVRAGVDPAAHPRDLSEGQRLCLVLAVQLTARPRVLLLDEPTRGLDHDAKLALRDVLRDLAADGHAVLLSTHDVEFVAEVADRVLVLAGGELVTDGPVADVLAGSPAYAPQVAKVVAPAQLLTVDEVRAALPAWPAPAEATS